VCCFDVMRGSDLHPSCSGQQQPNSAIPLRFRSGPAPTGSGRTRSPNGWPLRHARLRRRRWRCWPPLSRPRPTWYRCAGGRPLRMPCVPSMQLSRGTCTGFAAELHTTGATITPLAPSPCSDTRAATRISIRSRPCRPASRRLNAAPQPPPPTRAASPSVPSAPADCARLPGHHAGQAPAKAGG
jgi:hypothetical protein